MSSRTAVPARRGTWKVMTQRDEGAGLSALPVLGAGLRAVKVACG